MRKITPKERRTRERKAREVILTVRKTYLGDHPWDDAVRLYKEKFGLKVSGGFIRKWWLHFVARDGLIDQRPFKGHMVLHSKKHVNYDKIEEASQQVLKAVYWVRKNYIGKNPWSRAQQYLKEVLGVNYTTPKLHYHWVRLQRTKEHLKEVAFQGKVTTVEVMNQPPPEAFQITRDELKDAIVTAVNWVSSHRAAPKPWAEVQRRVLDTTQLKLRIHTLQAQWAKYCEEIGRSSSAVFVDGFSFIRTSKEKKVSSLPDHCLTPEFHEEMMQLVRQEVDRRCVQINNTLACFKKTLVKLCQSQQGDKTNGC